MARNGFFLQGNSFMILLMQMLFFGRDSNGLFIECLSISRKSSGFVQVYLIFISFSQEKLKTIYLQKKQSGFCLQLLIVTLIEAYFQFKIARPNFCHKNISMKCLVKMNYYFSLEASSMFNSIPLNSIFTAESVKERISTFKLINHENQAFKIEKNQILSTPSIKNPSYLNFDTAKNLSQFIKQNKIPSNIRILHALAHIEYNAFMAYTHTYFTLSSQILDTKKRQLFQHQIKKIALDEGDHFCLLNDRLQTLGWKYGSIPVIDQLCLAIEQTKVSLIDRIARISLLHEGKGMNAIRKLISQLQKDKDEGSIKILRVIEQEEVYHFQNGVKWFAYICDQEGKEVEETCKKLMERKEFRNLGLEDIINSLKKCNQ